MNNLDKQYIDLLQDILDNGYQKGDRTGTGTISVFGRQIRHKMSDGFPLITTKKMYWKGIVTELIWFLRGDTNIKFLVDNDCHIWDGDAYKSYLSKWNYESFPNDGSVVSVEPIKVVPHTKEQFIYRVKTDDEFAEKWGDLGKIYGFQWRSWGSEEILVEKSFGDDEGFGYKRKVKEQTKGIDQITNLIRDLKTNPDSRRLMVNAWNVGELDSMVLPPCHYGFQVYTRELEYHERRRYRAKLVRDGKIPYRGGVVEDDFKDLDDNNIPSRAISLMYNARSQDVPLGTPFNIASYALLLEIIGKMVNMVPDELVGNMGDCHIYINQIDGVKEQIGRELRVDERVCMCYENPNLDLSKLQEGMSDEELTKVCDDFNIPTRTRTPFELPTLKINSGNENWDLLDIDEIINSLDVDITFRLENYQSHPAIKIPLSN